MVQITNCASIIFIRHVILLFAYFLTHLYLDQKLNTLYSDHSTLQMHLPRNFIIKSTQNPMSYLSLSSILDSISSIKYLSCPDGGLHEGEPLNRICVDKNCTNKGLVCVICEEDQHKKHQTIHVKQFLNILMGDKKNKYETSISTLHDIEKSRELVRKLIDTKRMEVDQEFQKLQNDATRYYDQIDQLAKNLFHAQGPIQKIVEDMIYGSNDNLANIKKRMGTVLNIVDFGDQKEFSIHTKLDNILKDCKEKQSKVDQVLSKLMTDATKTLEGLGNLLSETLNFDDSTSDYAWSKTLKGAKINITNNIAEQTGMESSGQRFILMEKELNRSSSKKTWGIKVKKFGGWIGIGISLKSEIVKANYNFHYTILGHGSYLISTNGYSWSHSVKEFNSAFKCFTFAVGDTVYIEYNPVAGKIKFRKNDSTESKDQFELDVSPPPAGDSYHPSANLCSTSDSVEIILPGKPLN